MSLLSSMIDTLNSLTPYADRIADGIAGAVGVIVTTISLIVVLTPAL